MAECFLVQSGGVALNFKVVGNPQPQNPKENTIWVNTDVPITGYGFSAMEPESLYEGMVWITTGTSSTVEFNALKKNGIQVYPISAKQYIGGAWVDKPAQSFQNGNWNELEIFIIHNGALANGRTITPTNASNCGSLAQSGDVFLYKTNGNVICCSYTDPIDLTGRKNIILDIEKGITWRSGHAGTLIVSSTKPSHSSGSSSTITATIVAELALLSGSSEFFSGIRELPINLEGEYYLVLTISGGSSIASMTGDPSGYLKIRDFYIK